MGKRGAFELKDIVHLSGNPQCVGRVVGKRYGRPFTFSIPCNSSHIDNVSLGYGGVYYDVRMENGTFLADRHECTLEKITAPNLTMTKQEGLSLVVDRGNA